MVSYGPRHQADSGHSDDARRALLVAICHYASRMSEAPDRSARRACWEKRDEYFKCLDDSADKESSCSKQKAAFEKNCAASWVSRLWQQQPCSTVTDALNQVDYFIKRRQLQKRQDAMYARDAGNLATQAASVPNNGRP